MSTSTDLTISLEQQLLNRNAIYARIRAAIELDNYQAVVTVLNQYPYIFSTSSTPPKHQTLNSLPYIGPFNPKITLDRANTDNYTHVDDHPLFVAVKLQEKHVVELLLKEGCPVSFEIFEQPKFFLSPLSIAVQNQSYDIIQILTQNGANATLSDSPIAKYGSLIQHSFPLLEAIKLCDRKSLDILLLLTESTAFNDPLAQYAVASTANNASGDGVVSGPGKQVTLDPTGGITTVGKKESIPQRRNKILSQAMVFTPVYMAFISGGLSWVKILVEEYKFPIAQVNLQGLNCLHELSFDFVDSRLDKIISTSHYFNAEAIIWLQQKHALFTYIFTIQTNEIALAQAQREEKLEKKGQKSIYSAPTEHSNRAFFPPLDCNTITKGPAALNNRSDPGLQEFHHGEELFNEFGVNWKVAPLTLFMHSILPYLQSQQQSDFGAAGIEASGSKGDKSNVGGNLRYSVVFNGTQIGTTNPSLLPPNPICPLTEESRIWLVPTEMAQTSIKTIMATLTPAQAMVFAIITQRYDVILHLILTYITQRKVLATLISPTTLVLLATTGWLRGLKLIFGLCDRELVIAAIRGISTTISNVITPSALASTSSSPVGTVNVQRQAHFLDLAVSTTSTQTWLALNEICKKYKFTTTDVYPNNSTRLQRQLIPQQVYINHSTRHDVSRVELGGDESVLNHSASLLSQTSEAQIYRSVLPPWVNTPESLSRVQDGSLVNVIYEYIQIELQRKALDNDEGIQNGTNPSQNGPNGSSTTAALQRRGSSVQLVGSKSQSKKELNQDFGLDILYYALTQGDWNTLLLLFRDFFIPMKNSSYFVLHESIFAPIGHLKKLPLQKREILDIGNLSLFFCVLFSDQLTPRFPIKPTIDPATLYAHGGSITPKNIDLISGEGLGSLSTPKKSSKAFTFGTTNTTPETPRTQSTKVMAQTPTSPRAGMGFVPQGTPRNGVNKEGFANVTPSASLLSELSHLPEWVYTIFQCDLLYYLLTNEANPNHCNEYIKAVGEKKGLFGGNSANTGTVTSFERTGVPLVLYASLKQEIYNPSTGTITPVVDGQKLDANEQAQLRSKVVLEGKLFNNTNSEKLTYYAEYDPKTSSYNITHNPTPGQLGQGSGLLAEAGAAKGKASKHSYFCALSTQTLGNIKRDLIFDNFIQTSTSQQLFWDAWFSQHPKGTQYKQISLLSTKLGLLQAKYHHVMKKYQCSIEYRLVLWYLTNLRQSLVYQYILDTLNPNLLSYCQDILDYQIPLNYTRMGLKTPNDNFVSNLTTQTPYLYSVLANVIPLTFNKYYNVLNNSGCNYLDMVHVVQGIAKPVFAHISDVVVPVAQKKVKIADLSPKNSQNGSNSPQDDKNEDNTTDDEKKQDDAGDDKKEDGGDGIDLLGNKPIISPKAQSVIDFKNAKKYAKYGVNGHPEVNSKAKQFYTMKTLHGYVRRVTQVYLGVQNYHPIPAVQALENGDKKDKNDKNGDKKDASSQSFSSINKAQQPTVVQTSAASLVASGNSNKIVMTASTSVLSHRQHKEDSTLHFTRLFDISTDNFVSSAPATPSSPLNVEDFVVVLDNTPENAGKLIKINNALVSHPYLPSITATAEFADKTRNDLITLRDAQPQYKHYVGPKSERKLIEEGTTTTTTTFVAEGEEKDQKEAFETTVENGKNEMGDLIVKTKTITLDTQAHFVPSQSSDVFSPAITAVGSCGSAASEANEDAIKAREGGDIVGDGELNINNENGQNGQNNGHFNVVGRISPTASAGRPSSAIEKRIEQQVVGGDDDDQEMVDCDLEADMAKAEEEKNKAIQANAKKMQEEEEMKKNANNTASPAVPKKPVRPSRAAPTVPKREEGPLPPPNPVPKSKAKKGKNNNGNNKKAEVKTEEPKVEEVKTEEPKVEEAKTEEVKVVEEPKVEPEVVATEEPVAEPEVVATEEPKTQEPEVVEEPKTQEPEVVVEAQIVATEEPKSVEAQIVATEEPKAVEEPAVTTEPVEEPAVVTEPVEEPKAVEEPVKVEEVKTEEPVKVEEVKTEEPVKVEEAKTEDTKNVIAEDNKNESVVVVDDKNESVVVVDDKNESIVQDAPLAQTATTSIPSIPSRPKTRSQADTIASVPSSDSLVSGTGDNLPITESNLNDIDTTTAEKHSNIIAKSASDVMGVVSQTGDENKGKNDENKDKNENKDQNDENKDKNDENNEAEPLGDKDNSKPKFDLQLSIEIVPDDVPTDTVVPAVAVPVKAGLGQPLPISPLNEAAQQKEMTPEIQEEDLSVVFFTDTPPPSPTSAQQQADLFIAADKGAINLQVAPHFPLKPTPLRQSYTTIHHLFPFLSSITSSLLDPATIPIADHLTGKPQHHSTARLMYPLGHVAQTKNIAYSPIISSLYANNSRAFTLLHLTRNNFLTWSDRTQLSRLAPELFNTDDLHKQQELTKSYFIILARYYDSMILAHDAMRHEYKDQAKRDVNHGTNTAKDKQQKAYEKTIIENLVKVKEDLDLARSNLNKQCLSSLNLSLDDLKKQTNFNASLSASQKAKQDELLKEHERKNTSLFRRMSTAISSPFSTAKDKNNVQEVQRDVNSGFLGVSRRGSLLNLFSKDDVSKNIANNGQNGPNNGPNGPKASTLGAISESSTTTPSTTTRALNGDGWIDVGLDVTNKAYDEDVTVLKSWTETLKILFYQFELLYNHGIAKNPFLTIRDLVPKHFVHVVISLLLQIEYVDFALNVYEKLTKHPLWGPLFTNLQDLPILSLQDCLSIGTIGSSINEDGDIVDNNGNLMGYNIKTMTKQDLTKLFDLIMVDPQKNINILTNIALYQFSSYIQRRDKVMSQHAIDTLAKSKELIAGKALDHTTSALGSPNSDNTGQNGQNGPKNGTKSTDDDVILAPGIIAASKEREQRAAAQHRASEPHLAFHRRASAGYIALLDEHSQDNIDLSTLFSTHLSIRTILPMHLNTCAGLLLAQPINNTPLTGLPLHAVKNIAAKPDLLNALLAQGLNLNFTNDMGISFLILCIQYYSSIRAAVTTEYPLPNANNNQSGNVRNDQESVKQLIATLVIENDASLFTTNYALHANAATPTPLHHIVLHKCVDILSYIFMITPHKITPPQHWGGVNKYNPTINTHLITPYSGSIQQHIIHVKAPLSQGNFPINPIDAVEWLSLTPIDYPSLRDVINDIKAWGEAIQRYQPNQPYFNLINNTQPGQTCKLVQDNSNSTISNTLKDWLEKQSSEKRMKTLRYLGFDEDVVDVNDSNHDVDVEAALPLSVLPISFIWPLFSQFYMPYTIGLEKFEIQSIVAPGSNDTESPAYRESNHFYANYFDGEIWEQYLILKAMDTK